MIDISQGLYRAVLAITAAANRVITFPDRTFTVADNADLATDVAALAAHVALTDTAHGGTAWATYVPTWAGLSIGDAVVSARWCRRGKLVFVTLIVTFGPSTTFSGTFTATIPVTAHASAIAYGGAQYYDANTGDIRVSGAVLVKSTTTVGWRIDGVGAAAFEIDTNTPWTWDDPDIIACSFWYEAA